MFTCFLRPVRHALCCKDLILPEIYLYISYISVTLAYTKKVFL
jgi:hypothetical protein